MAAPLNDDSKVMFQLLKDRGWHNYDEIVNAVAAKVPPGRAMRRYEQSVRLSNRRKVDPAWDPGHDDATRIELGAKRCAYAALSNWNRQNALDLRGYRENKEVRVKPEWSSRYVPGFEHPVGAQDPPSEGEGYTDLLPDNSEPSEVEGSVRKALSGEELDGANPAVMPEVRPEGDQWVPVEPEPEPEQVEQQDDSDGEGDYAWPRVELASCELCGLAISDEALHGQWHEEQKRDPSSSEMALLNESQVSELIRVVVSQELDKFQQGMQYWLASRFAQLEASIGVAAGVSARWSNPDVWRPQ